ncbi:MAG TPA: glycosyltransferase family 1 protein [Fimbriimonadaceae bacterium]|nr:glycosyltransferase family 1 protein [Fimbriimonadaceae bacterium]
MPQPLIAIDARMIARRGGGDTSYWRGLVCALPGAADGLDFVLLADAPRPAGFKSPFDWVEVAGQGRFWSMVSFPNQARRLGAQVVHTQYTLSPLAGKCGVTTIHDVSFFIGPEWFSLKDRLLMRATVPDTVKRAAIVLTVSETSKQEIEKYIPGATGKVRVTPNALGDNIRPVPHVEAERIVREELGISGPYILTVGTRWPRKNMALAIEAAALLPETLPHRLVVAGKAGWGSLPPNERTTFAGYVSDAQLTALYQCAALYVAPSLHEGFGIPLLEAWACGCPVVCSTGGALPEVAGDAALVVQGWEAEEWAGQIASLLGDSSKLERLRERGRSRLGDFSWDETAKKTVQAYREVIG